MGNLVIVSNRGPFSFSEDFLSKAEECLKQGASPDPPSFGEGGLVQAMAGLLKPGKWNPTWIGASMGDRDIEVARGHYKSLFDAMVKEKHAPEKFPHIEIGPDQRMHFRYRDYDFFMRFVFFDTKHMHSYYSKFANGLLWPIMHLTRPPLFYLKTKSFPRPAFEKNDFIQYASSAVSFANTISDEIRRSMGREAEFVVWNQDYHLMQIAELYKALLVEEGYCSEDREKIHVGQFMHTPFFNIHEIQGLIRQDKRKRVQSQVHDPFGESMETVLQKITWGMLANDFIGFHTKEYCDNFLEALEEWFPVNIRVVGNCYEINYQHSVTTIGAFPIGLDVDRILFEVSPGKNLKHSVNGSDLYEKLLRDRKEGRTIFGGLERCDYTKGLLERLEVFSRAFAGLKEIGKDARFYQVTAPSRSDNPDYKNLQFLLDEEVAGLNRDLEREAIVYMGEGIPAPENYRFMKEIDVMLVTPLEDGMNLVAFEYILSQKYRKPEDRGMLVLSSSGASRVLRAKGFGEKDGVVYVNPMRPKDAGAKTLEALKKGLRVSEKLITYVEKERRVEDWAEQNIQAILNSRKSARISNQKPVITKSA
jgi:trehalose-6-phosphate synthase